jgi:hypothetical protein
MTARPRRVAEGLDDLENVNVILDCMQERRRGTVRGVQAQVHFGLVLIHSFCCESNKVRWSGGGAMSRWRG